MAGKQKTESKLYIVIPRTNDAAKEGFAKANGKVVPFDRPVRLDERDITVLKRMREPIQAAAAIDPRKIMEEMQVSQEQANQIARARAQSGDMGSRIEWVPKYSVHPA